ncbi:bromodomain-containing protein 4B [Aplysia californica]|uniref:Bromodomain-containing protein 4B n=1 Tax=Aplysia californica TaxID=6500 RepID=A0ABM1ADY1_APLCA|nr:bromodomain-containing protein 4B [Aplysia californica]
MLFSKIRKWLSSKKFKCKKKTDRELSELEIIAAKMSILGKPLNRVPVVFVKDCGYIPSVLTNAAWYIEKHIKTPELFQTQGSTSKVNTLIYQMSVPRFTRVRNANVHDVIEVVKTFLVRLPDPLLPDDVCDAMIEASESDNNHCGAILSKLRQNKPAHFAILHFMMKLLGKVAQYVEYNNMDVRKLATIFVLDILKPLKLDDTTNHVPLNFPTDRMQRLPYLIMVVENLILNINIFRSGTCSPLPRSNAPSPRGEWNNSPAFLRSTPCTPPGTPPPDVTAELTGKLLQKKEQETGIDRRGSQSVQDNVAAEVGMDTRSLSPAGVSQMFLNTSHTRERDAPSRPSASSHPVVRDTPANHPVVRDTPASHPVVRDTAASHPVVRDTPASHPVVRDTAASHPVVRDTAASHSPPVGATSTQPIISDMSEVDQERRGWREMTGRFSAETLPLGHCSDEKRSWLSRRPSVRSTRAARSEERQRSGFEPRETSPIAGMSTLGASPPSRDKSPDRQTCREKKGEVERAKEKKAEAEKEGGEQEVATKDEACNTSLAYSLETPVDGPPETVEDSEEVARQSTSSQTKRLSASPKRPVKRTSKSVDQKTSKGAGKSFFKTPSAESKTKPKYAENSLKRKASSADIKTQRSASREKKKEKEPSPVVTRPKRSVISSSVKKKKTKGGKPKHNKTAGTSCSTPPASRHSPVDGYRTFQPEEEMTPWKDGPSDGDVNQDSDGLSLLAHTIKNPRILRTSPLYAAGVTPQEPQPSSSPDMPNQQDVLKSASPGSLSRPVHKATSPMPQQACASSTSSSCSFQSVDVKRSPRTAPFSLHKETPARANKSPKRARARGKADGHNAITVNSELISKHKDCTDVVAKCHVTRGHSPPRRPISGKKNSPVSCRSDRYHPHDILSKYPQQQRYYQSPKRTKRQMVSPQQSSQQQQQQQQQQQRQQAAEKSPVVVTHTHAKTQSRACGDHEEADDEETNDRQGTTLQGRISCITESGSFHRLKVTVKDGHTCPMLLHRQRLQQSGVSDVHDMRPRCQGMAEWVLDISLVVLALSCTCVLVYVYQNQ